MAYSGIHRQSEQEKRGQVGIALLKLAILSLGAVAAVPTVAQTDGYPKVLRYDEDYSHLADPDQPPEQDRDVFDPVKFVPLNDGGTSYLTLHGEWRERLEVTDNAALAFNGTGSDTVLLHRVLLGADLHLGPSVRIFTQLGAYDVSGRKGAKLGTDRNDIDLPQAFLDVSQPIGADATATLRVGRQEMLFGSGRLVAIREGPNARRSFDGARAMVRSAKFDVDLFVSRAVRIKPGAFDDASDDVQSFWGVYTTTRIAPPVALDLYYLGIDRDRATFAVGAGKERRHSLGARLWGRSGALDYNAEGVWQFGDFAGQDIRAYTAALDWGYTLDLPLSPRLGMKANISSGDKDPADNRLGTFNPLFPNHAYFSEAGFGAPMNAYDLQPNITVRPASRMTVLVGLDFFWKNRKTDAIYNSILTPYPGTAGSENRYIGTMFTSHLRWQPTRRWEFNLDYSRIDAGAAVLEAGGNNSSIFIASAAFRF